MTTTVVLYVIGAVMGGIVYKYLMYNLGKKAQKSIQQEAEIAQGNKEKKILEKLSEANASSDDELISRLRGKRRR